MFKSIVLAITMLLGQSGQDLFLINTDQLKEKVADKEALKKLKKLAKTYKGANKEFNLLVENQADEFAVALTPMETESQDLRKAFRNYKLEGLNDLSNLMDLRIQIQSIPETEEWNEYVEDVFTETKIPDESEITDDLRSLKQLIELEKAVRTVFLDSKYETQALDSFQKYVQTLVDITRNEADRQLATGQILVRKNASRNQLQKTLEDRFLFQDAMADAFIRFRADILKISDPEDWNQIVPELSKLVYE